MSFPSSLNRVIVLDLETSGLDPVACSILQVGAVPLHPDRADCNFERTVRHEWWHTWEAGAEKVHGETQAEASSLQRVSAAVALDDLLEWLETEVLGMTLGRAILAGVNPRYDYDFLWHVAVENDWQDRFRGLISHRTLDMHTLAVAWCATWIDRFTDDVPKGLDGLATDSIYRLLGHAPEAKPHRALEGARREATAIRQLLSHLNFSIPEGSCLAGSDLAI